jgi:hypothetical protein
MRDVVRIILSGSFFAFGYWLMFFTARQQTLHDLIAGTLVVRSAGEHEVYQRQVRVIDHGLAAHEDYWDGSQWVKRPVAPH